MKARWVAAAFGTVTLVLAMLASRAGAVPDDVHFTHWGSEFLGYLSASPYYLSAHDLLALPVLPPPPANSSPLTRAELDELLALQANRTPEQRATIVAHIEYAQLCALFVGATEHDLAVMPLTHALLDHVNLDGRWAVFHAKRRFERARPTQLDARLRPSIPVPHHPAYPSSHAIQGCLLSRVLSALAPAAHDRLEALGVQVAHEREIAGVHYASDSAAGRALGEQGFALLQTNQVFARELDAARAEWGMVMYVCPPGARGPPCTPDHGSVAR